MTQWTGGGVIIEAMREKRVRESDKEGRGDGRDKMQSKSGREGE